MTGLPIDNDYVTKHDVQEAENVYANMSPSAKTDSEDSNVVTIPSDYDTVHTVKKMSQLEIAQALKQESIRLCFALELAKNGVTLENLAKKAVEGLDAYKVTKFEDMEGNKIHQPDFIAQHMWWESVMKIYGMNDMSLNPVDKEKEALDKQKALEAEKALDFNNMDDEQLEAAIKGEIYGPENDK